MLRSAVILVCLHCFQSKQSFICLWINILNSAEKCCCLLLKQCGRENTDRLPGNPLHDEVLAGLQVFDDVIAQRGFGLDEALDHFVEVEGGQAEDVQYPGETHVRSAMVASSVAVTSIFKAAL